MSYQAAGPVTKQRRRLFLREKGRCFYCDVKMTMALGMMTTCTRDHIVPCSRGGHSVMANMVASCFACNNARGTMDADAFLTMARRLGHDGILKLYHGTSIETEELSLIFRRLERQIRKAVKDYADLRFPARESGKMRKARFQYTDDSATFKLAEIWPAA